MRRPRVPEILAFLVGSAFLVIGIWVLPVPPELNRLWVFRSWLLKGVVAAAGLGLIAAAGLSLRSEEGLFSSRRLRELGIRCLLLGLGLGAGLMLAEIVLRLQSGPVYEIWSRPDPVLHHYQKEGLETRFVTDEWNVAVRINDYGLRDEPLRPRSEVEHRILVLGDSYVWGYGVEAEQRLTEVLEKGLDPGTEVVNAGVVSYSPLLEYLFLKEKGLALEPDLVILLVDMSDLQDDLGYTDLLVTDSEGRPVAVPGPVDTTPAWKRWFKGMQLVRRIRTLADGLYARSRGGEEDDSEMLLDLRRNRFALTRDDVPPEMADPHWERTLGYLDRIVELMAEKGIPLVVGTYPYGHQVSPDEWALGRHHYRFAKGRVYGDHPSRRLEAWAEERGVPFFSLFETFRSAETFPLYFPRDGHFNTAGHRLAGEAILRYLKENGFIPLGGAPAAAPAEP